MSFNIKFVKNLANKIKFKLLEYILSKISFKNK